jgi:AraC-like DNA-binding protein
MSTALACIHGRFGRASLYRLNKPLAPHAHREGHLIFHVTGAPATVVVEGAPHRVGPGEAVAISPWQPHDFRPGDWASGAVFLTLYISPRWFLELAAGAGHAALRFGATPLTPDAVMSTIATRVTDLLVNGRSCDRFQGELFALTAAAFEQSWSMGRETVPLVRQRVSDFRIRNALRLMDERVSDACVLDRIARDAGLSRPHFYKLFRQNIGITPNMYLNTLRMERSIARLTESDDPVTSIGLDLGFASQASFTRFFCNNVGMAPTDYRRASLLAA